jgi:hypothetical protein
MKTETRTLPDSYRVLLTLAQLLERFERNLVPTAPDQYRSVVAHLKQELGNAEPGEDLDALLNVFPAAAQLYENLQYENAGLCRSPLDASLSSEVQARDLLKRFSSKAH